MTSLTLKQDNFTCELPKIDTRTTLHINGPLKQYYCVLICHRVRMKREKTNKCRVVNQ